jgi:death-on-curing family protein
MASNGIQMLEVSDVISIHEALTRDFENSNDPISPPGIKDMGLLESAVSRQYTGFGGRLKYDDAISNSATLCYGICCNHALHNGNKRTALVALLCHLDKNGLTPNERADQDEMYRFMLKVAGHRFAPKRVSGDTSDAEINEMAKWLRTRTRKVQKSERIVTYKELENRLRQFGVFFEKDSGNYADVYKVQKIKRRKGFFGSEVVEEKIFIANIPYYRDGRHVGKKLIRTIRKNGKLMPENGVDSDLFYGDETTTDEFIMKYKTTLKRLAKT